MHFTKGRITKFVLTFVFLLTTLVLLSGTSREPYEVAKADYSLKPVSVETVPVKLLQESIKESAVICAQYSDEPVSYGESENIQEQEIESEPIPLIEEPEYIPIEHTDVERIMMECVVEGEAHGSTLEHKQIVACVILNRLNSDSWNYESIEEVLTAENQFSAISNYYNHYYETDPETVEAVRSVLAGEVDIDELSQGATFFYSPKYAGGYRNSFERRTFLFEIDGNRFFK